MNRKTLNHLHHALATDVLQWTVRFHEHTTGRVPVYHPGFDEPIPTEHWQPSRRIAQAERGVDRLLRLNDDIQHWKTFREEDDGVVRHRVLIHTKNRVRKTLFYSKPERALVAGMLCFASPERLTSKYYRCFDRA